MFGFLIAGEVSDDAVRLKTFTDMVLNKYRNLPTNELGAAIQNDFDKDYCHIATDTVNFRFKEIEEFLFCFPFWFERHVDAEVARALTVFGKGKYAGFVLHVAHGKNWHCSVNDGFTWRSTGGAKKLVQLMEKKFGIRDFTKFKKGFS